MTLEEHWEEYKAYLEKLGHADAENYKSVYMSGAAVVIVEGRKHLPPAPSAAELRLMFRLMAEEIIIDEQSAIPPNHTNG